MKILASGDHHFDQSSRWDECVRVHDWIADEVERQRPDVFLSAGDIFERGSTPAERKAVAEWLTRIAEVCPVLATKGNHDRYLDPAIFARLHTAYPILVEEACGVHYVGTPNGMAAIAAVAWPNRASLAAMLQLSGKRLDAAAGEALRQVLTALGAELALHAGPRMPKILLGHFMIDGSKTSLGQPLVGAELNVPLGDLALAGADITIAGHIHCPQDFEGPVVYVGSPYRTAYGELEEKSVLCVEFDGPRLVGWRRIPTPATPMLLLVDEWAAGRGWLCGLTGLGNAAELRGADVRISYSVDADQRDAAKLAAAEYVEQLTAAGAIAVKCEELVRATTRARAPEVALAKTLDDKLRACWKARGIALEPAREERLLRLATELEMEATS